VLGAVGTDLDTGEFVVFDAEVVVLAAGGYTGLYRRHSSRDDENTGGGPALAYQAGAALMGERFMERYSPDQMELDARDVVARAIAQEITEGRGTENGSVYLDLSHRERAFIKDRLPRMVERFEDLGVDMAKEPIEVAPTAHYGMGGVRVDDDGETAIEGLYAIGETMAGVHGANRLGGNSLAETIAFGKITGEAIADRLGQRDDRGREDVLASRVRHHVADLATLANSTGAHDPGAFLDELRSLLQDRTGILRDEKGFAAGLDRLAELRSKATDIAVGDPPGRPQADGVPGRTLPD